MTEPGVQGSMARSRVHLALAATALLLGLLAAFAEEPGSPDSGVTEDSAAVRAATVVTDSVVADSAAPRRRLDGRRGCAW
jgi:hypothetical protein